MRNNEEYSGLCGHPGIPSEYSWFSFSTAAVYQPNTTPMLDKYVINVSLETAKNYSSVITKCIC